jgi:hypothetical protein
MLLDLVGKVSEGNRGPYGPYPHLNNFVQELTDENSWNRMESDIRDKALNAINPSCLSSHLMEDLRI